MSGPRRRRGRPGLLPALPPLVWLCLFFLIPTALVAVFSAGESTPFSSTPVDLAHPTLARYREAASDTFRLVFVNTLELSVVGTALCLGLAFPMAYLITRRLSGRWKMLAIAAVVIPYWMPFLLRTYSWRILLGDNGIVNSALQLDDGLGILDTFAGAQLGVVYNYLPLAVLPIAVALDKLDPSLRWAGRDLGASRWRVFWQVTVPAARPGVIAAALLVFIPLMGDYVTPSILGGVQTPVVGSLISESFLSSQDWALGAAAAVLLIGLVGAVLGLGWVLATLVSRLTSRVRPLDLAARLRPRSGVSAPRQHRAERDLWGGALRVFGALLLATLWAPILVMVAYSFNRGRTLNVWGGFGTRWYAAIPANEVLVASIGVSLRVAAVSTVLAVALGTLAGLALARSPKLVRGSLSTVLLVVFVSPEIVTGVGLLLFFVSGGTLFGDGFVRLVLAHSVLSIAVVAFTVRARLAGLDPRLADAAADLGAPPWAILRRVTIPLVVPAVVAAAILASTFSLDDVVVSSLVSTVGTTTLPVYIFSSMRNGLGGDAATAGVLVMWLVALSVLALSLIFRRRGQWRAFADGLVGG